MLPNDQQVEEAAKAGYSAFCLSLVDDGIEELFFSWEELEDHEQRAWINAACGMWGILHVPITVYGSEERTK